MGTLAFDDLVLATPIQLRGEIDAETADSVVAQLREVDGPVVLEIQSGGGCALSSRRICRAIERHGNVHGEIDCEAVSGGAIAWLCCETRSMKSGSALRLHYCRMIDLFLAHADAATLFALAQQLDEIDGWIRRLVMVRTHLSELETHEFLLGDRRLDRDAARRLGFWG